MALALLLIVLVVALPVVILVRHFRAGDESVAGGSQGRQLFGGNDDDWGPKSTKQP